ncbi:MAG: hypothetical protein ACU4F9_09070 [Arcticibacter sp.]
MIRIDDNTVFNPETGEFGYLPDIIQFEVDRTLLIDSTPAIVTWTVSNATKVLLNNEIVEPTGTKEFHSNDLIEIVLIAENDLGQTTPRKLAIDIDRTPPIIHSFFINEQFAIKGSPIKLSWNVEGATTLSIDNGVGSVTGLTETITSLGSNGIYKLSAKNYFGIESISETAVTIFPTPIIENIFIPRPELHPQAIAHNQPTFNISLEFNSSRITPNVNFVELNSTGTKIFSRNISIKGQTNNFDTFDYLTKKQKEITYIAKSVWKREVKKILKRILLQS